MCVHSHHCAAVSDEEVKQHVMNEARLPKPSHVHPALYSVCMQCWNHSPQARLSMDALITSIATLMTDRDAMTGLPGLRVCTSVSAHSLTHSAVRRTAHCEPC